MIRVLIALLIAANLAFFGWTRGWLDTVVGVPGGGGREPDRQQREVRPELVQLLTPEAAVPRRTAAPSPAPQPHSPASPGSPSPPSPSPSTACLEAGPFDAAGLEAAGAAMHAALPGAPSTTTETEQAGGWLVYIGRYADPAAMARREANLTRRNLPYTEVTNDPALTPGLALGRFDDRAGAVQALERFTQLGLSSARVVETSAPIVRYRLRVDPVDPDTAAQLKSLTNPAFGSGFAACAPQPGR